MTLISQVNKRDKGMHIWRHFGGLFAFCRATEKDPHTFVVCTGSPLHSPTGRSTAVDGGDACGEARAGYAVPCCQGIFLPKGMYTW